MKLYLMSMKKLSRLKFIRKMKPLILKTLIRILKQKMILAHSETLKRGLARSKRSWEA